MDLASIDRVHVQETPESDERSKTVGRTIATTLELLGVDASFGPDFERPDDTHVVVTYRDRWMWDMSMYLIQLSLYVRNVDTGEIMASGSSTRMSLQREDPDFVAREILEPIFRQSPDAPPSEGKALLYITRPDGDSEEYLLPVVDDRVVGGLLSKGYLRVEVDPGKHRVYGTFAGIDRSSSLGVQLSAGDVAFVELRRVPGRAETEIGRVGIEEGRRSLESYGAGVAFLSAPNPPARAERPPAEGATPPPGRALVYVVRSGKVSASRMGHSSVQARTPKKLPVILDGQVVALMPKRSYLAFEVAPGVHSLAGGVFEANELDPFEFVATEGGSYFFHVSAALTRRKSGAAIDPLSESEGRTAIRGSRVSWLE
jgi:hypothetical protein